MNINSTTKAIYSPSLPSRWMPVILGILTAVGPVSTDIYLPAFPQLEKGLHGLPGSAQFTLSVWFVGLAIGQITLGPLSDRFGRRGPMLIGTVIYTLSSIGCAMAPNIVVFSVFRFFASLGASASLVVPSAAVRDIVRGNMASKMMSQLVLIMGIVPILAPTLGGLVLHVTTWRAIFWASAVYGMVCIFMIWRVLPETLIVEKRVFLPISAFLGRYITLCKDRGFISHSVISGFSAFVSFTYLSAAPAVFMHLFGLTPAQFGMMFGLFAVGMIGASQLNGMLVSRVGSRKLLSLSTFLAMVGTLILTILAIIVELEQIPLHGGVMIAFVVFLLLTLATTGMIGPNAMVGALANHPRFAGSAAAFIGTLQYVLGAVAGFIIGKLPVHSVIPMAVTMLLGSIAMVIAARLRPLNMDIDNDEEPELGVISH
ncbi:multidrug effflux MFS transporter [Entomobacter blattae]|uniref:Bcr/CflA family efflux transporter n=1 Tax=Entomobacter blattae TaxID=2762277 RepID=A0A7H1NNY7_9PROT|nr:multidrug effflux MFS transporter [Entomobacter blattae]QNT77497.1 Bicyclomycin resistance protein [Entomobacter blattae]